MSVKDLTQNDFDFFRNYAQGMMKCHENEFVKCINPDIIRAMYRGRVRKDAYDNKYEENEDPAKDLMAFSRLFQATNTVPVNLYYQNPAPIVLPLRGSDPNSAALMAAIIKHYMKLNEAKRQNREAVLNAWFFGIGWKKLGYRTVFTPRVQEPETAGAGMADKLRSAVQGVFGKPDNSESRQKPELVDYETLFNDSENPMNVMLDHKADIWNGKVRLWRFPRTIHDLEVGGDYDEETINAVIERMKSKLGSRFDSRETDLHLNELHIIQRNGLWILTWLDEYELPLKYEKLSWQGKGFLDAPLVLTNEPGIRYPVSHLKVASQVQMKLDNLANMYVQLIARSAHFIAINEKNLNPGQVAALEKNILRGILKFRGPITPGDLQSFQSGQVPADMQNLMVLLQANTTEIMGTDEQLVAGRSKNDTLGQDELARMGTNIREGGMQDSVRDWMIDQFRKEGSLIKQYSNGELHLVITGKDYSDPVMGQRTEDKWVEFMTESNPLGAKHSLQGEFDYDMNIEEAVKPNKKTQQAAYEKLIPIASNPQAQDALLQDNMRLHVGSIWKEYLKTFDGIGNVERFLEKLNPVQKAAIQTAKLLQGSGMHKPSEEVRVSKSKTENESGVTKRSSVEANR